MPTSYCLAGPRGMLHWLLLMLATYSAPSQAAPAEETSTPAFSLTCYTCVNVSDNEVCNQYAIDRPCPPGKTFCHTLHAMDHIGDSWLVNKKCAERSECTRSTVGCSRNSDDGQTVCVSCCDESYCNEPVPRNNSTATLSNTRNHGGSVAVTLSPWLTLLLFISLFVWSPDVT